MLSLQSKVSTLQRVSVAPLHLTYALGIRDSKNYKGSEIQRLRALRSRFLTPCTAAYQDKTHSVFKQVAYRAVHDTILSQLSQLQILSANGRGGMWGQDYSNPLGDLLGCLSDW